MGRNSRVPRHESAVEALAQTVHCLDAVSYVQPPRDGVADILIVEDEPDLAATCRRFLERMGYRTRVAHTGLEALALAEAEAPDLVLADVRLPGQVDGLEVVRRLREKDPRLLVIVCTAHASDRSRQAALAAGAAAFLSKPFSLAELRAVIEQILRRDRPAT